MSKAFTKENENDGQDEPEIPDPLPPNTKNYMTPFGFETLRNELRYLMREERPKVVELVSWAAGNGDRSENGDYIYGKKRLREIDRRVRYLNKSLDSAVVVDPKQQAAIRKIFFGATVTYARAPTQQAGAQTETHTVKLVGVDEADLDKGKISWQAPVAQAMMKAEVGDTVKVGTPNGTDTLTILKVVYVQDTNENLGIKQ